MSKSRFAIFGILSLCIICLIFVVVVVIKNVNFTNKSNENTISNNIEEENNNNNNQVTNNSKYPLIKLKYNGVEKMIGGELININDYQVQLSQELVDKGYSLDFKDDVLEITSSDKNYKCIMLQISDNYIMPTEEEIDAFYETDEYENWKNEEYDRDNEVEYKRHWEKYDEIQTNYYKKLGYTAKSSPDFVLTPKEQNQIIGEYLVDDDVKASGSNGLFPGTEYYKSYSWGRVTTYAIPKYYYESFFGESTSDFSVYIYFIEYYDNTKTSLVNLLTL